MSFDWITVALTLIGGGGTLGLLALFIMAPAAFGVVMEGLQTAVGAITATRLGCALLAAVLAATAADQYRVHVAGTACQAQIVAREAKADKQAKQRDTNQATAADSDAKARIAELEEQTQQDQEKICALQAADKSCHPITADELR